MAQTVQLQLAILALYPDLSAQDNPWTGEPADFRVMNNPDGTQEITEWNTAEYPEPTSFDIARGWYLYNKNAADGRMGIGYVEALRALVPEMTQVLGVIDEYPEGWLAVVVTEVMRNNNPTRTQAVATLATTWNNKRNSVKAVTVSASPTEQEYLDKAATLEGMTW
jgi:hypothetical protein